MDCTKFQPLEATPYKTFWLSRAGASKASLRHRSRPVTARIRFHKSLLFNRTSLRSWPILVAGAFNECKYYAAIKISKQ